MGNMNRAHTIVRLFLGSRSFNRAPVAIQKTTNAPCGIPNRVVWSLSYPSPWMTSVLNYHQLSPASRSLTLEIPPLGMFATKPRKKNMYVL